jgi:hypothetical protein
MLSLSSSEVKSARVRIVYDPDGSKAEQTVAKAPNKEPD